MKLFKIIINDEDLTGMDAISLVEQPAVEYSFLKFNEEVFQAFDDAEHIITGVVALADKPIYRYSYEMGSYYVIFEKDTIKKMVEKYSKSGLFNSINLNHDNNPIEGVYLIESYIKDSERGIVPKEFADIPDGSWLCSFKVENDELWKELTTKNTLNGFSLQGVFQLEECLTQKFNQMNPIQLRNLILRLSDVTTDKGTLTVDGEITIGADAYLGNEVAPDGEYLLEAEILVIKDGKIAEIIEKEATEEVLEEVVNPEVEELKTKITELEGLLENRDAIISELTEKLKEAEAKLHESVEEFSKPSKRKTIYDFK